ncbi:hypothetical protein Q3G72_032786 [Acer saccharum]|nr:hypothetical protein Q3G72_032786 [Acer saccharum]
MVAAVESEEEESDEESRDSMESFPPLAKRGRVVVVMGDSSKGKKEKEKEKSVSGSWGDSVRMLTQAIMKFEEAYEQAESVKIHQYQFIKEQVKSLKSDLILKFFTFVDEMDLSNVDEFYVSTYYPELSDVAKFLKAFPHIVEMSGY